MRHSLGFTQRKGKYLLRILELPQNGVRFSIRCKVNRKYELLALSFHLIYIYIYIQNGKCLYAAAGFVTTPLQETDMDDTFLRGELYNSGLNIRA
jgi:hypothetical protein